MRRNRALILLLAVPVLIAGVSLLDRRAEAEDPPVVDPAVARKALTESVKKGQALWKKQWHEMGKTCFQCHNQGPNRMLARRIKAYPKYDFGMQRVVTAQEKIRQMIKDMSGGEPPALGHADLVAIEAYLSTVRR